VLLLADVGVKFVPQAYQLRPERVLLHLAEPVVQYAEDLRLVWPAEPRRWRRLSAACVNPAASRRCASSCRFSRGTRTVVRDNRISSTLPSGSFGASLIVWAMIEPRHRLIWLYGSEDLNLHRVVSVVESSPSSGGKWLNLGVCESASHG
jgi:hypothetical protein